MTKGEEKQDPRLVRSIERLEPNNIFQLIHVSSFYFQQRIILYAPITTLSVIEIEM
jgi:hypothetical protein